MPGLACLRGEQYIMKMEITNKGSPEELAPGAWINNLQTENEELAMMCFLGRGPRVTQFSPY